GESVAEFDGGHRVHSQVLQSLVGVEHVTGGVSEDGGHVFAHVVGEDSAAFRTSCSGQLCLQSVCGGLTGSVALGGGKAEVTDECARTVGGERGSESGPVDGGDGDRR